MRNHKMYILVAATLAASSLGAFAQSARSTAEELQALADRTAILEAQLKAVELENKIQQQNNDLLARGAAAKKPVTVTNPVDRDTDFGTPMVSYVEGIKGALEAVLLYRGNVRQRVKEGDVVYGSIVKKIALNEVVLVDVKSKSSTRLQFGTTPVTRDSATTGQAGGVPTVVPPGMPR